MAEETTEQEQRQGDEPTEDGASPESTLARNNSLSRLNARAPEFVPRTSPPGHPSNRVDHRMVQMHPVMRIFQHPSAHAFHHVPHAQNRFDYYGSGGGGYREAEVTNSHSDPDRSSAPGLDPMDVLSDEAIHKITNQVEYYFSDINLATTEHLMRFISKDPEGFVPVTVIAGFKKIKALIGSNSQLAAALRTSSKLVVSDDGKKVRRVQPFTDADLEELQSRIVVAENLPEDHSYQNLVRVFSMVGRVKSIRTCYPQTSNMGSSATSKSGKMDIFLGNKLHAFVEYETPDEAERAVAELNEEKNWRSGLRLRLLPRCMIKHGQNRVRKGGSEMEGTAEDEDASTSNHHPHDRHSDDPALPYEASHEHLGDEGYHHERDGGGQRGRGRGRAARGRGRGQYLPGCAAMPVGHPLRAAAADQAPTAKHPIGPRMPDGTRGFAIGRGKTPPS
ncbi:la-related protein 6B-like [Wolffia australiana]